MLLLNKKETAREAESARLRTDGEAANSASNLNELEIIREDGRQLKVEREKLLKKVGDLRDQIIVLEEKRDSLFDDLGRRGEDDISVRTKRHLDKDSVMTADKDGDAEKLTNLLKVFGQTNRTEIRRGLFGQQRLREFAASGKSASAAIDTGKKFLEGLFAQIGLHRESFGGDTDNQSQNDPDNERNDES